MLTAWCWNLNRHHKLPIYCICFSTRLRLNNYLQNNALKPEENKLVYLVLGLWIRLVVASVLSHCHIFRIWIHFDYAIFTDKKLLVDFVRKNNFANFWIAGECEPGIKNFIWFATKINDCDKTGQSLFRIGCSITIAIKKSLSANHAAKTHG